MNNIKLDKDRQNMYNKLEPHTKSMIDNLINNFSNISDKVELLKFTLDNTFYEKNSIYYDMIDSLLIYSSLDKMLEILGYMEAEAYTLDIFIMKLKWRVGEGIKNYHSPTNLPYPNRKYVPILTRDYTFDRLISIQDKLINVEKFYKRSCAPINNRLLVKIIFHIFQ